METFRREPAYAPYINPEFENGSESSRSRHTRVPWLWTFHYRGLSTANKDTIMAFWRDTCLLGSVVFHWIDPSSSTAYFVRFAAQPSEQLEGDGTGDWRLDIQLKQALGSYT